MSVQPERILGIDPGTRNVGYAVVERDGSGFRRLTSGCVVAGNGDMPERLVKIHRALQEVITEYQPQAAAIETVFSGENPKTSIAIGEGRGVAVLSAAEMGLTVVGYEPALVKRAVTGNGRAGKDQVRRIIAVLLKLAELPATDHEADALALALTHGLHCRLGTGAAGGAERRLSGGVAALIGKRALPEAVMRQLPQGVGLARGRSRRNGRKATGAGI